MKSRSLSYLLRTSLLIVLSMGLIVGSLTSCGNQPKQDKTADSNKPLSLIDSLNKKVNEGHDLAMSKMGSMVTLQKSAKSMIDSLQKTQPVNQVKISALQKADHNLENIKGSMYTWMEEFDFDLKNMDSTKKVEYLRTNLERIQSIDDSTKNILEEAKKALQS